MYRSIKPSHHQGGGAMDVARHIRPLPLIVTAVVTLMAVACDSAPAAPSGPTSEEIRDIVQDAVSQAEPEGTSPEEIRAMVEDAVERASESDVTREDVQRIVQEAIATLPTPAPATGGPTGEPVKIGTVLDYTGDLALFGPPMRNGADIAAGAYQ